MFHRLSFSLRVSKTAVKRVSRVCLRENLVVCAVALLSTCQRCDITDRSPGSKSVDRFVYTKLSGDSDASRQHVLQLPQKQSDERSL